MKITIYGCGHLGLAFAKGLVLNELSAGSDLILINRNQTIRENLKAQFDCVILDKIEETVSDSEVIFIGVRPQDFATAAPALCSVLNCDQLIISPMAGPSLELISAKLAGHTQIIRSMPNLPVQIGSGITPFVCHPKLERDFIHKAERIFGAVGDSLQLDEEALLDTATAISGTGPAYVFYFIEHFKKAAVSLGLTTEQATRLVRETIINSVGLWQQSGSTSVELRNGVRTKGGTTDAAFKVFEDSAWGDTFQTAIKAAFKRSKELGQNS